MQNETSQQRGDRLLREDQTRRATHPATAWSNRAEVGKIHDMYCRCRACKPPYDQTPTWIVPTAVIVWLVMVGAAFITALVLRSY